MRKLTMMVVAFLVCFMMGTIYGAEPNQPENGITVWALGGSPADGGQGAEELRLGWMPKFIPTIEFAGCIQHLDAPPEGVERWPLRGYILAHALDAQLLASLLGNNVQLPEGNLYAGLFAQYAWDRDDELSGGWVAGGLVSWPKGWESVVEYQNIVWNAGDKAYFLFFGLRKLLP